MRAPTRLQPGDPTEVGPFRLLGRLATGGMGVVYLARRENRPESLVALKLMRPEHARLSPWRERFRAEVAASQRLARRPTTQTHVARIVEADTDASVPWLAAEFVPGPTVSDAVRDGPLSPRAVADVAGALAEALMALHSEGLVHGDVKAANVVLGPDGIRLVDLGLARESDEELSVAMGSPAWAAPEQHVPGHQGAPADVFGWGMTVAVAATGRHPFGDGGPEEIATRMRNAIPDLEGVRPDLRPLVAAALAPDPLSRPSASELVDAIDASTAAGPGPSGGALSADTVIPGTTDSSTRALLATPTLIDVAADGHGTRPGDATRGRRLAAVLTGLAGVLLLGLVGVGLDAGPRSTPDAPVQQPGPTTLPMSPEAAPSTRTAVPSPDPSTPGTVPAPDSVAARQDGGPSPGPRTVDRTSPGDRAAKGKGKGKAKGKGKGGGGGKGEGR